MVSINPRTLNWVLRSLPNFCWPVKVSLIRKSLKRAGKNFRVGPASQLADHRQIEVGDNVFMGDGTIITVHAGLTIGNNVMFGPQVMIIGGDHRFDESGKPMSKATEPGNNLPIVIEDDVWIGARATILKGVTIGEGSVVGTNSLVTAGTLPYSISVGAPSRFVRCRFDPDVLKAHLKQVGSKYTFEQLESLYSAAGQSIR